MKTRPVAESDLLYIIAVALLVLWGLGFASAYTIGGFIHALLLIAAAIVLVRMIGGRRLHP
jgi:uncharacterized protein DUF5670